MNDSHTIKTHKIKTIVVCFSGLDPSGGAGLQADIESLNAHNCHCLPLATLNSVQDSQSVYKIIATDVNILEEQFTILHADIKKAGKKIDAIKIGMLGSLEQINFLSVILKQFKNTPIILDPIFASGLGNELAIQQHIIHFVKKLLPFCTVATPNSKEALQLARTLNPSLNESSPINEIAELILSTGLENLVITGTHSKTEHAIIEHHLFSKNEHIVFEVARLAGEYHGSGCTFAASLAANLSHGCSLKSSVQSALNFTQQALEQAIVIGCHQQFPNRRTKQNE